MPASEAADNNEARVEAYTRQSDLTWVLGALTSRRDDILGRWLETTAALPFHAGRPDGAVADHIPELFDALVAAMERSASPRVGNQAPLEDEAVLHAAQAHAAMRVEQGFQPTDVLAEFRVLRHELWHALRQAVPDSAPVGDVVSAQLLLNDAIDGAVSLALVALTDRIYELREEFLATAVHEVRQPITLLSGYAQIAERVLSRPEPDLARARNAVVQIKAATLHVAAQLSALADASRSTLGQFTISPTAVDLATVVEESVAALGPDATGRIKVRIEDRLDTHGDFDGERLLQVFGNLLSNALKYSQDGSAVTLFISSTDCACVSPSDRECLAVSIHDEGIGIPADELSNLFKRYARASNALHSRTEGLGLGLYLCRVIVEAHGGCIWAESCGEGRGTTLKLVLPRER